MVLSTQRKCPPTFSASNADFARSFHQRQVQVHTPFGACQKVQVPKNVSLAITGWGRLRLHFPPNSGASAHLFGARHPAPVPTYIALSTDPFWPGPIILSFHPLVGRTSAVHRVVFNTPRQLPRFSPVMVWPRMMALLVCPPMLRTPR